jgi:DNA adenine methylase
VNSRGAFNVPAGRYVNPGILDRDGLRAASEALAGQAVEVAPFEHVLNEARRGDFVYFDPPYHPISETSDFTAYTAGGFGMEDQRRLAAVFRELASRGCAVMLSNSDTPFIRRLYAGFRRSIASSARAPSTARRTSGAL